MTPFLASRMILSADEITLALAGLAIVVLCTAAVTVAVARLLTRRPRLGACAFLLAVASPWILGFLAGCASNSGSSTPPTPADVQARRALAVEAALSIGLVPVLQNNPDYIPAAQAVAATLDTITKDTLTPEDITAFIAAAPVKEKDRPTVSAIVVGAWLAYSAVDPNATGVPVQPAVKPFLNAAARGLRSAASAAIANPKR